MTTQEKLEALFAKVRALPEPRQLDAIEVLAEITEEEQEPYQLSEDELSVLRPALEDAKRGENLIDIEDCEILNKPWA
jgi:hypothetical protein